MTYAERQLSMIRLTIRQRLPILTCERHPEWASVVLADALAHLRTQHAAQPERVCRVWHGGGKRCERPAGHAGAHGRRNP